MRTGLKRNLFDKYYTEHKTVSLCLDLVKQHIGIDKKEDLIVEPSAGNGAFIDGIKSLCDNTLFIDLIQNIKI